MRRLLLLTTLLMLLAAVPAHGATRVVVRGHGWGHGIGMSQHGALGYAQHGRGYQEILAHYYRGTRLSRTSTDRTVRVLLQATRREVRFRGATRAGSERVNPATTYVARRTTFGLLVRSSGGKRVGRFVGPLTVNRPGRALRLLGPALNGVRDGLYRGSLVLSAGLARGVTAVNALPLDPYVQGVVAGEMPSSWHREALKVQAVAARSYALATRKPGATFDQYPDTRSQVYRGVGGEVPSTNGAVLATAGEILTYGGAPAVTYFFSTSGGYTENVENVFLGAAPKPYLKGVPDPYDGISPRHSWSTSFTTRRLAARLGGYLIGRFRSIRVLSRGVSPRIVRARVDGTGGSRAITGPALSSRLGLYDTWASFTRVTTSRVRSARSAGGGRRAAQLGGVYDPAPRKRVLVLERRVGGRWVQLKGVRTSRGGRYRVAVRRGGVYRVRAGSVAGPAVPVH